MKWSELTPISRVTNSSYPFILWPFIGLTFMSYNLTPFITFGSGAHLLRIMVCPNKLPLHPYCKGIGTLNSILVGGWAPDPGNPSNSLLHSIEHLHVEPKKSQSKSGKNIIFEIPSSSLLFF